jgi:hypothetical protein
VYTTKPSLEPTVFSVALSAASLAPGWRQSIVAGRITFEQIEELSGGEAGPINIAIVAVTLMATNSDEARRNAEGLCRKIFPVSAGWSNHRLNVAPIAAFQIAAYGRG